MTRAEPAFEALANHALVEALGDASPRVRGLALELMTTIRNRDLLVALRRSFEADTRRFVGVARPNTTGIALFHDWLLALAHNFIHHRAEAPRALGAADPYLSLPEAGRPAFISKWPCARSKVARPFAFHARRASDAQSHSDHPSPVRRYRPSEGALADAWRTLGAALGVEP